MFQGKTRDNGNVKDTILSLWWSRCLLWNSEILDILSELNDPPCHSEKSMKNFSRIIIKILFSYSLQRRIQSEQWQFTIGKGGARGKMILFKGALNSIWKHRKGRNIPSDWVWSPETAVGTQIDVLLRKISIMYFQI